MALRHFAAEGVRYASGTVSRQAHSRLDSRDRQRFHPFADRAYIWTMQCGGHLNLLEAGREISKLVGETGMNGGEVKTIQKLRANIGH